MTTTAPAAATATIAAATVTELLTSLFAGTRLFDGDVTSPRAAYQDALYSRTTLVDLRPASARLRQGRIGLDAVVLDADHGDAATRVRRLAETSPVTLISTDGSLATRIADQLRAAGLTWVEAVEGGFTAWRASGLPVRVAA